MRSALPAPGRLRVFAILFVVLVGLLNFHVPHFLLESSTRLDAAGYLLASIHGMKDILAANTECARRITESQAEVATYRDFDTAI